MTTSEALASFKENGYVVIPNALAPDEVAFLNEWVNRDQAAHPGDWHGGQAAPRSHGHPLMESPELDPFVQHPSTLSFWILDFGFWIGPTMASDGSGP